MGFFARLCRDHARLVVFLWLLLTIPVVLGIGRIEVKSGQRDLIPTRSQSARTLHDIDEVFGGINYENVMVESEDLLTYPMIKKFILLEKSLREQLGEKNFIFVDHFLTGFISNVLNEAKQRAGMELKDISLIFYQEGFPAPSPLQEGRMVPFQQAIEEGVQIYLANPVARKWMVEKGGAALLSPDLKQAMIRVKINPTLSSNQQMDLARRMEKFFHGYFEGGETPARVVISGDSSIDKDLGDYIYSSTWLLAILALLLLMGLLYITFQRFTDIFLPLLVIFISALWIYGLMGWLGLPYTVISVILGPLVLGINLGNLVYMMSRFYEEMGVQSNEREAAHKAVRTVGVAIFLAAITTVFGFITFQFSIFDVLRQFGWMAGLGVGICFLLSVTMLPSLMVLREEFRARRRKGRVPRGISIFSHEKASRLDRFLIKTAGFSSGHRRIVLTIYCFVVLMCILGTTRLTTTSDLRELAPKNIPSLQAQRAQEKVFGGQQIDVVLLRGDVLRPDVMAAMHDFQVGLGRTPFYEGKDVTSIAELLHDYLAVKAGKEAVAVDPAEEMDFSSVLPAEKGAVEEALSELSLTFGSQEGKLITTGHDGALINIYSQAAKSSEEMLEKNEVLRQEVATCFDLPGISFEVGGTTLLTKDLLGNLVPTQLWTVFLALLLSGFVLVVIFRSLVYGLVTLTVLVAGVAVELGFLVLVGWQLDMMTVLIASLVVGMGIDYGIHVTHRFREEFHKGETGVREALDASILGVGKPLLAGAVSTAGAFGIIVFSKMTPIKRFGAITAVSLLASLTASLVVLPSLLSLIAGRRRRAEQEAAEEIGELQPLEAGG